MPRSCGVSACFASAPIRPSFSERSVARWVPEAPLEERTCLSSRSGIGSLLSHIRGGVLGFRGLRTSILRVRLACGSLNLLRRTIARTHAEDLAHGDAAKLGDILRPSQALEAGHGRLHQVDG